MGVMPVIAVLLVVLGVLFIAHGVSLRSRGRASLEWPMTTGRLRGTGTKVMEVGWVPIHRASVEYFYRVNDVGYVGDTAFFGDSVWLPVPVHLRGRIRDVLALESCAVYYNPRRPQQSVLMPGVHWLAYAAGAEGIVLILAGLLLWLL